jgi:hypothetical protein
MQGLDIAHRRLRNQHIVQAASDRPADIVRHLGAVQAQDYLGALWAIALRMPDATEATVEQAIAARTIIRTWPMRGTLHFVAAPDIRWMLELLTPRIVARSRRRLQQLDLEDSTLARSKDVIGQALQGGKQLSRADLYQVLEAAHISPAGQRGIHILARLAQDGLICFGARAGKQQTFALLDEWAPATGTMERANALAELARRYFTSHGPATLPDFVWWSGLPTADARAGLEGAMPHLTHEQIDGRSYWLPASPPMATSALPSAYLLPPYDEYTVAYKDRSAMLSPEYAARADSGYGIMRPAMVVDGQVVGTWNRAFKKDRLVITLRPFRTLGDAEHDAFTAAARRYGEFLEMPLVVS